MPLLAEEEKWTESEMGMKETWESATGRIWTQADRVHGVCLKALGHLCLCLGQFCYGCLILIFALNYDKCNFA